MAATAWQVRGEYLENCNCTVLCPCIVGPRSASGGPVAEPTEGHCDVPMVFEIERGRYGETVLDGLHAAYAIYTPKAMGLGDWTLALYVDERGDAAQRQALEQIFGGHAGGPMARFGAAVSTRLPTEAVPIRFAKTGPRGRRAEIPGILEIEVEGIEGGGGSESWLDNVRHPVSSRLAIARAVKGLFKCGPFDWDNTDRNAHYASFDWQGP
jgi:hypothetical protein